jgi:hypothetical protein
MSWLRKHVGISIALFFLAVLPIIALGLVYLTTPIAASCQQCQTKSQSAIEVSYADLLRDAEKYRGQTIRVAAIFDHDAGYTSLRNPAKTDWKQALPVGFGANYFDCALIRESLIFNTGLGGWYDGIASVKVVGMYGDLDDQRGFQKGEPGLTILCIEEVKPNTGVLSNLFRYTLGKVGRLIFLPAKS